MPVIVNIEMPKRCADCPIEYDSLLCGLMSDKDHTINIYTDKEPDCPLIKMPVNTRGLVSLKDVKWAFDFAIMEEAKTTGKVRATSNEIATVLSNVPILIPEGEDDNVKTGGY